MPRPLLIRCAAPVVAASATAVAVLTLGGLAGPAAAASAAVSQQGASPVSVAITSVTPGYAKPGDTVTVRGTLTNVSASPLSALAVQLRSSDSEFVSRGQLQEYAAGTFTPDSPVYGAVDEIPGTLAPRSTVTWSVPLHVNQIGMSVFGVYPLAAQAQDGSGNPLATSRTFLPYWPATKALQPQRQQIAWIWPLIDQPRQGMCPHGLLNNGLAASLASGGRLSGLLAAGAAYSSSARLTWAIDPALLGAAATMTRSYQAGGDAGCQGRTYPASAAAAAWLAALKSATAAQPVFVTPYADADIAALTRYGMNADLTRAFSEGRSVASGVLGRSFSRAAGGADASPDAMAWPADGVANYAVLENLAASDGIGLVVLASSVMPPQPTQDFTPSAQTTTPDGEGPALTVLLSDDTITQVIGSANAPSDSKATAFAAAQRYLAETAMIAAELPGVARSVVVAPPRRWDPPAGLAGDLLAETVSAPWLRPASLSQLAAAKNPPGQVSRRAPAAVSRAELKRSLLTQVRQLNQQVKLVQSIRVNSDPALGNAVADVESSAWRGGGAAGREASALVRQFSRYLSRQEDGLSIIVPPRVTLTGLKGPVPVSISNGLGYAVQVRLQVGPSRGIAVRKQPHALIIQPGQQEIVKDVSVTAAAVGSTRVSLRLLTPQGAPLASQATVIVQATHYGTLALVIIAAALGVFVLASAARAIRRGRRPAQRPGDGPGQAPDGAAGQSDSPGKHSVTDNVVAEGHQTAHGRPRDPTEETDDYAWAPGRADRR